MMRLVSFHADRTSCITSFTDTPRSWAMRRRLRSRTISTTVRPCSSWLRAGASRTRAVSAPASVAVHSFAVPHHHDHCIRVDVARFFVLKLSNLVLEAEGVGAVLPCLGALPSDFRTSSSRSENSGPSGAVLSEVDSADQGVPARDLAAGGVDLPKQR